MYHKIRDVEISECFHIYCKQCKFSSHYFSEEMALFFARLHAEGHILYPDSEEGSSAFSCVTFNDGSKELSGTNRESEEAWTLGLDVVYALKNEDWERASSDPWFFMRGKFERTLWSVEEEACCNV